MPLSYKQINDLKTYHLCILKQNLNMRIFFIMALLSCSIITFSQGTITGVLFDTDEAPVSFANMILYSQSDSVMVKVESTDIDGKFTISGIANKAYYLEATYIGNQNLYVPNIVISNNNTVNLGTLTMASSGIELETALVTAQRSIVEIRPDRTVFNVQGTINSAGDNGLDLLRKAPGVLVDNNENISVLGRAGVLVYVDGKRLPLSGDDLTNYLRNLPSEQIDKIDIISNPGAKYEAEGNAGILDIRLKKAENQGYNGSLGGSYGVGKYARGNVNANGNFRNKNLNAFGTIGYNKGTFANDIFFESFQNGLFLDEEINFQRRNESYNWRFGTDFFLAKNHTIGFLVSGGDQDGNNINDDVIEIATFANQNQIDSVLVASNTSVGRRQAYTFNINYAMNLEKHKLNVDLDYGQYDNVLSSFQPNQYFLADRTSPLSEVITSYDTPVKIDIATFKVDYETNLWGGNLSLGSKLSKVATDNTYLFFDIADGQQIQNDKRSNLFFYDENVYAGYVNYSRAINKYLNFSGGLRVEYTDAKGDLRAFLDDLQEEPVDLNYINYFPSAGLTFQKSPNHIFNLNYGKRINRPDYNVLNPFKVQISELSSSKGNAFLRPEIVNNIELGYTLKYMYNFKLSYSKTYDQITRLIGPDEIDPRAGFITWENLAEQDIYSFNASAPIQLNKWWNMFTNSSLIYLNNQADYGEGAIVDVQAFSYTFFQQNTFTILPNLKAELSGYYSGPGVWGGVFRYDPNYSINIGLQKTFFNRTLNVKLNFTDITYNSGWNGTSEFNGLVAKGHGTQDSRRVNLTASYNFGNSKVRSRNRKTGLESESSRVSSGG